jgi:hypothetical protein
MVVSSKSLVTHRQGGNGAAIAYSRPLVPQSSLDLPLWAGAAFSGCASVMAATSSLAGIVTHLSISLSICKGQGWGGISDFRT